MPISLGHQQFGIYGYMVWVAILYAVAGSWLPVIISSRWLNLVMPNRDLKQIFVLVWSVCVSIVKGLPSIRESSANMPILPIVLKWFLKIYVDLCWIKKSFPGNAVALAVIVFVSLSGCCAAYLQRTDATWRTFSNGDCVYASGISAFLLYKKILFTDWRIASGTASDRQTVVSRNSCRGSIIDYRRIRKWKEHVNEDIGRYLVFWAGYYSYSRKSKLVIFAAKSVCRNTLDMYHQIKLCIGNNGTWRLV